MKHEEYNGWTNYETWIVNLWLDNDPGLYDAWRATAKELGSTFALAQELQTSHQENIPETVGPWADLLNAALSEVNWMEIAEHIMESVEA